MKEIKNLHKIINGPAVAVDTVVFAILKEKLMVLLLKIGSGPYKHKWALPGGLVRLNENLEQAALRVLGKKTNISEGHLEQLYTFGSTDRDIRGQIVSVAYLLLIYGPEKYKLKTTEFYTDIKWKPIKKLPRLAFDHQQIIELAYQRLKDKMMYSNIAYSLLTNQFTLTKLQQVYEIIWDKEIDKRNFQKKMKSLGIVSPTKKVLVGPFRPAKLYQFNKKSLVYF